jgi:H+/gluconate symporter-like permease
MPAAAVITIIGALLTVVVLAAYLISIALVLRRVNAKLSAVTASLPVVAQKTEPVGSIIGDINNDLAGVDSALRSVLAKAR